ncbi:hypothetical protein WR25_10754 [Diploscapter pachys]|uniref:Uncharacterized protein n=1 Tax=Diploscapter pachys TaxID=2018661 RepID=A0A2A2JBF5_9BILA|nr:hypothetical protein WR25_10754 [Diploscapter pachys]
MVITPTYNPHYASCKVNNGQMTTLMNKIMMKHYEKNKVAEDFLQEIERKIFSLEIHFSKCFQTAIKLQLYGSMLNGFGTTNCDVDLSLVFAEGAPFWATSSDVVMRFVSKCLVDLPNVIDARYISAKVPIVRFRFQDSDIDIDISYNNMLALHNSYLLKQYTYWDQRRIPILGVFIKKWAKINHIGDASQGSLSSYAWIIMLLYYLQTLRPFGLIPILQESQSGTGPRMVHGWNVAYSLYVDPSHCSKLNGSVYDLFLGFLHFYANQFNFADLMVQVAYRRIQPKPFNWKKFAMAIEDPFEKTHNLAQGISEQMLTHIRSCMLNTISVFTNAEHISTFCSANDVNLMFIEESFNLNEELLGKLGEHLLSLCILPNPPPATRRHRHRSTSLANSLSNSTDNSSILV